MYYYRLLYYFLQVDGTSSRYVVLTYDGSTLRLYVDGVEQSSTNSAQTTGKESYYDIVELFHTGYICF